MVKSLIQKFYSYGKKLKRLFKGPIRFRSDGQLFDLIIFDDIFPNPLSDWRLNEFLYYIRNLKSVCIYTGRIKNDEIIIPRDYSLNRELFLKNFGKDVDSNNISPLESNKNINGKLAYFLFYHNLNWIFPYLEKNKVPFAFTLYPGGQFALFDTVVRDNLLKFTSSPLFRHVFVNMPNVYDYAINELKIEPAKVSYFFSGPIEIAENRIIIDEKRYWSNPLMICFASHKYMRNGLNKGFDVFCSLVKKFEKNDNVRFFIIGNYTAGDNLYQDTSNITYLGEVSPIELRSIFKEMHIIVSPVRSHVLHPGNFDGFPTGAALNAVLNGCVLVTTDPHDNAEKLGLKNGTDLFLTSDRPSDIFQIISRLINDRELLYHVARNGYNAFFELTRFEKHKIDKLNILKKFIEA